jgi:hypothetical protein
MARNKRTDKMIASDRTKLKQVINEHFNHDEFLLGQVYYKMYIKYNQSKMAMMYADFRALVIGGFLTYRIGERNSYQIKKGIKKHGAVYKLNLKEVKNIESN